MNVAPILLHAASLPSPYSWDSEDSKMIDNADIILAADGNGLVDCYANLALHQAIPLN